MMLTHKFSQKYYFKGLWDTVMAETYKVIYDAYMEDKIIPDPCNCALQVNETLGLDETHEEPLLFKKYE